MADEIDRAQHHNELHQTLTFAAWRAKQPSQPGRKYCLDCDEEIPLKRRHANPFAVRCISCQRDFEAEQ